MVAGNAVFSLEDVDTNDIYYTDVGCVARLQNGPLPRLPEP